MTFPPCTNGHHVLGMIIISWSSTFPVMYIYLAQNRYHLRLERNVLNTLVGKINKLIPFYRRCQKHYIRMKTIVLSRKNNGWMRHRYYKSSVHKTCMMRTYYYYTICLLYFYLIQQTMNILSFVCWNYIVYQCNI